MEKATLPVNSTIFDSFLLNQLHQINLVAGIGPLKKKNLNVLIKWILKLLTFAFLFSILHLSKGLE